jgi:hypothetical protein
MQVSKAAKAAGLAPLFGALDLDVNVHSKSLALAVKWFERKSTDTVADMRVLPADALTELVESLGLPPIKAERLREALKGEPRNAIAANAGNDGETGSICNR